MIYDESRLFDLEKCEPKSQDELFKHLHAFAGSLQVRYQLGGLKEPFAIDVDQRNLANGQPHSINLSRVDRRLTIQVVTVHTHSIPQTAAEMTPLALCHF